MYGTKKRKEIKLSLLEVGIPVYNGEKYIKECIDSVLNQTFEDLEIYVYDNASTDGTGHILNGYIGVEKVHLIRKKENEGPLANWNDCITSSDAKYVSLLCADDAWKPNHAEMMVRGLEEHSNCVLAYSPCDWIDENSNLIGTLHHPGHKTEEVWGGRDELGELLVYDDYITISSAVFRNDAVKKVGKFDVVSSADWQYFLRFGNMFDDFYFNPNPTCLYRKHEEQDSTSFYNSDAPLITHCSMLLDFLQYGNKEKLKGYSQRIWSYFINRCNMYPQSAYGLQFFTSKIGQYLQELDRSLLED